MTDSNPPTDAVPEPAPLPFRVEALGDPPRPYLVHDGGRRDLPFDRHTMRSAYVPVTMAEELQRLWDEHQKALACVAACRQANAALAANYAEVREAAGVAPGVYHADAVEAVKALAKAAAKRK